jgi:hypothetical protein
LEEIQDYLLTLIVNALVVAPTASLTRTVKAYGLLVFAVDDVVPLITPPLDNCKSGGRVPLASDHVYGGVPPLAASVAK